MTSTPEWIKQAAQEIRQAALEKRTYQMQEEIEQIIARHCPRPSAAQLDEILYSTNDYPKEVRDSIRPLIDALRKLRAEARSVEAKKEVMPNEGRDSEQSIQQPSIEIAGDASAQTRSAEAPMPDRKTLYERFAEAPTEKTNRQYVYDWMNLPTHTKIGKLKELGLYEEGDLEIRGDEQDLVWIKRAKEKGLLDKLLGREARPVAAPPNPSCSVCGTEMKLVFRCEACGSTPECVAASRSEKETVAMTGVELIAQERQRQIAVEDWDADHDDRHDDGDLARAAMCYADPTAVYSQPGFPPDAWPWESEGWKPKSDAIKNLVRAGALIAAEIDRLARARQAVAGKEEKTK